MKYYQVIFVDEYNNFYEIGSFANLVDAEPLLNSYLENYELADYDIDNDGEVPQFGEDTNLGHLVEYPSTYSTCFDRVITVEEGSVEVRGFVKDTEDTLLEMNDLLKGEKQ